MSGTREPADRIADAIFKLADTFDGLVEALDAIADSLGSVARELHGINCGIDMNEDEGGIAGTLGSVARALRALGNADAATPMGAMEMLAKEVRDGFDKLAVSVGSITE